MKSLKALWSEKPFALIVLSGLFFRLIAAVFSKGFGMSDDHFLVIEPAQMWIDGTDNGWLPKGPNAPITPSGHSFFYPGLHFLFFKFLEFIRIYDPQVKMLIVRIVHAFYSMITVIYGYKIAEKIGGKEIAKKTGLLLALIWFLPFLSVRNLVEVVCIPMLILASWMIIRSDKPSWKDYLLAGLFLGIGFDIRFQTIFFTGGFGLALLFQKKIKGAVLTGIGFLLTGASFQGICDFMIWHKPFVELGEYVSYNLANATTYYDKPWYNYLPLIFGLTIPPVSLFLVFGYFRSAKKQLILFLPAFTFFVFHSYFPNKQERFILPVIPFIIILGMIGWENFRANSMYWKNHPKLHSGFWKFFIGLNSILLIVVSLSYTKRNRVEAMTYLSSKNDIQGILIDDSNRGDFQWLPRFYLRNWSAPATGVTNQTDTATLFNFLRKDAPNKRPNYILFFQTENLEARKKKYENYFKLTYETTIQPSFIDDVMHRLNPKNVNSTTVIYRMD